MELVFRFLPSKSSLDGSDGIASPLILNVVSPPDVYSNPYLIGGGGGGGGGGVHLSYDPNIRVVI